MKSWTLKVAMMIVAALALTACPGKKGGGSAAGTPGAGGLCTPGVNGQCVGGVPFQGSGQWSGHLVVAPAQSALYRQFLIENQLCFGYRCNAITQWVGVSMNVAGNRARIAITPYEFSGWSRNQLRKRGFSYTQNNGNGFQIVVQDNRYYIQQQPQIYPQPIQPPQHGVIQLLNTFTTTYGNVITTTLYYRGAVIATGQLQGQRNMYSSPGYQQAPPVLNY